MLGPPGTAWQGTVLAPRARVELTYQHIFGSIVAESVFGTGEIGVNPPNPCLPDPTPCPEPSPTPTPTSTPSVDAHADHDPDGRPDDHARRRLPPTATPVPTPTPIPSPGPTPLPTVSPGPIVTPTPTPEEHDPSEPLDPEETPGHGGGRGRQRRGRHLQEGHDPEGPRRRGASRAGRLKSSSSASESRTWARTWPRDVLVCDVVPRGLTFVRATVKVTYRRGRLCVTVPHLTGQRQGFMWLRVARTARGRITNVAAVTSRESGRRTNPATIQVIPVEATGGGVTG